MTESKEREKTRERERQRARKRKIIMGDKSQAGCRCSAIFLVYENLYMRMNDWTYDIIVIER